MLSHLSNNQENVMKNIYILILFLILLVLSCCSFKSQTPSQTVLIIIDKISSGNTSNVREKLSTKSKIEPPYLINIILEYSEKNSPEIRREINNDSIASIIVGFNKQNSLLPRFLLFRLIKEENKWKINCQDTPQSWSPLHCAVLSNNLKSCKRILLQRDLNIYLKCMPFNNTALHFLARLEQQTYSLSLSLSPL